MLPSIKNHFSTFLKDKKVIIVGPDTALIGKKMGKSIDSYDIVIRHNTVFEYLPFSRELSKDFGSKTNVLYFAPQCFKDYANKKDTIIKLKTLKSRGLKYIVYQNGNRDGKYLRGEHCFSTHVGWFSRICKKLGIRMYYTDKTVLGLVKYMVNENNGKDTIPRTGFISVVDMVTHNCSNLRIVGMSFYHGGGHAFRKKCLKVLDPGLNAYGKDSGSHDSGIEVRILRDLVERCPWIEYKFPMDQ